MDQPKKKDQPKNPPAAVTTTAPDERRGFLAKAAAIVIGGIIVVFPFTAGLGSILDPILRRKKDTSGDGFISLARLDELQKDGPPQRFRVITDRDDAWSRQSRQPIGAVYLRRIADDKVEAFTATCPHAGCFVAFAAATNKYLCPCHNSSFELNGEAIQPTPSPRAMDTLETKLVKSPSGEMQVLVKFQQFYTGRAAKEVKA